MRTTQQLRDAWSPPCKIRRTTFKFWTGVAVTVDERILDALKALDAIMRRYKYGPKDGQTWGYNCRRITGGQGHSLHSYGIAIDVNSLANPYGHTLKTDMPRQMVAEIKSIRTRNGLPVWRWGGDYGGNKDAMHFEIVASPAELVVGIVSKPVPKPQLPEEEEEVKPYIIQVEGNHRYVVQGDAMFWLATEEAIASFVKLFGQPAQIDKTTFENMRRALNSDVSAETPAA